MTHTPEVPMPATFPYVERIVRIIRDRVVDDTAAIVLIDFARAYADARCEKLQAELHVCNHKLKGMDVLSELVDGLRNECVQAEAERDALEERVKAMERLPSGGTFPEITHEQRLAKAHCGTKRGNSADARAMRLCAGLANACLTKLGEIGGNYARAKHRAETAERERDEARRDAERYRWLRHCTADDELKIMYPESRELRFGPDLDAAIDAAGGRRVCGR